MGATLEFRTPRAFTVVAAALGLLSGGIVVLATSNEPNGFNNDPQSALMFLATIVVMITVIGWAASYQRVRVERNGTGIAYRNIGSWYRWRVFDASEVTRTVFEDAEDRRRQAVSALVLHLPPRPGRRWRRVRIVDHAFMGTGGSDLMRAIADAIGRSRDGAGGGG